MSAITLYAPGVASPSGLTYNPSPASAPRIEMRARDRSVTWNFYPQQMEDLARTILDWTPEELEAARYTVEDLRSGATPGFEC